MSGCAGKEPAAADKAETGKQTTTSSRQVIVDNDVTHEEWEDTDIQVDTEENEEVTEESEEDIEEYVGEESDENFTYDVYTKHAEVKKFIGKESRELTIPDEYNGLPVTVIDGIDNNSSLTKVVIGENVETIGPGAFYKDEMLLSVEFKTPEKLTVIDGSAFAYCELLSDFPENLPNLETIGYRSFCRTAIKSFTIPGGVKTIGEIAFQNCKKLQNISIVNGVEKIENNTFASTGIESVTIPDSVVEMGYQVFSDCSELREAAIGKGLGELPDCSFMGCSSLESITLSEGLKKIGCNVFYDNSYYGNNPCKLKYLEIPESVIEIGSGAFSTCDNLEEIQLCNGLETIGERAFAGCDNLKAIDIPDTVISIGSSAFSNCVSLIEVTVPGSVAVIEQGTFGYCDSLKKVIFNEGVLKLDERVFDCLYHYDSITDVILPDSIVHIDKTGLWISSYVGKADQANMVVTYKGKRYSFEQKDELFALING